MVREEFGVIWQRDSHQLHPEAFGVEQPDGFPIDCVPLVECPSVAVEQEMKSLSVSVVGQPKGRHACVAMLTNPSQ